MTAITTRRPAPLDQVLAYRHPGVLRRYASDHGASPQEAEELFREMLKMLYLCHLSSRDDSEESGFAVSADIEKIDRMWHTFLLFTRDYADFCERYFGAFLDHLPTDDDDAGEGEGEGRAPADEIALRSRMERQFAMVYDVLGAATLTAWYDDCRYTGSSPSSTPLPSPSIPIRTI